MQQARKLFSIYFAHTCIKILDCLYPISHKAAWSDSGLAIVVVVVVDDVLLISYALKSLLPNYF